MLVGLSLALQVCWCSGSERFTGRQYEDGDLYADTWVATDALGRIQQRRSRMIVASFDHDAGKLVAFRDRRFAVGEWKRA